MCVRIADRLDKKATRDDENCRSRKFLESRVDSTQAVIFLAKRGTASRSYGVSYLVVKFVPRTHCHRGPQLSAADSKVLPAIINVTR